MSYGTRKAIAGVKAGERFAHEGSLEAVRRFDACTTDKEISAVLTWARMRGGWFLRSSDDDSAVRQAYKRANAEYPRRNRIPKSS